MAVLIEGLSVVIRCDAVVKSYEGGIEAFVSSVPNSSLCADGYLACVRFLSPVDVGSYIETLKVAGLRHKIETDAIDIVVVDQLKGLCSPCNWAVFGKTDWNNDPNCPISVCSAKEANSTAVVVPDGWTYESSLTANHRFVEGNTLPNSLRFIRKEGELDVFQDQNTHQEFYVKRA